MSESVKFSIIIPFKTWSPDLDESLTHINRMPFSAYEVILLPDGEEQLPEAFSAMPVRIMPTGVVNPAVKRDAGAEEAQGEFLAFIDDDAYPEPDWLEVALKFFQENPEVGAVGGPGITPSSDPYWARVSGAVYLSRASGGFPERYVPNPPIRQVDDWPSVNLLVRRDLFLQVGGFDSDYWPGEDTLFCLKIVEQTNMKILYVPDMIVWHHRRKGLKKHLRQVGNYGLHRGFFVKRYPETSCRIKYFIPTLWVLFVLVGAGLSVLSKTAGLLYLTGWLAYAITLGISWFDIRRFESWKVALGALPHIVLTHLWYGTKFMQGLTTRELKSSLGR